MLKNTSHCILCEHSKKDFISGSYCRLTDEKPRFINKCSSIKFGKSLESKIIKINTDLKLVKNTKGKTMFHVYTYLTIGIMVLLADYFVTTFLWEQGWMSTSTIAIGVFGLALIPFAIAPLNKYKRLLKVSILRKKELDEVLKIYNYSYDVDIKLKKSRNDIIGIETKGSAKIFKTSTTKK